MRNEVMESVEEKHKPHVAEAVDTLAIMCDEARELAALLRDKLSPVLRPPNPQVDEDKKSEASIAPLAEVLRMRVDEVGDACCILREIKDRLEL